MGLHPIDRAMNELKKQAASKPKGTYTLEECARRWNMSTEQAKRHLKEMVEIKVAVEVPGKKISSAGQMVPTVYYKFPETKKK